MAFLRLLENAKRKSYVTNKVNFGVISKNGIVVHETKSGTNNFDKQTDLSLTSKSPGEILMVRLLGTFLLVSGKLQRNLYHHYYYIFLYYNIFYYIYIDILYSHLLLCYLYSYIYILLNLLY